MIKIQFSMWKNNKLEQLNERNGQSLSKDILSKKKIHGKETIHH